MWLVHSLRFAVANLQSPDIDVVGHVRCFMKKQTNPDAKPNETNMDFQKKWPSGLTYSEFLKRYASSDQHRRWDAVHSEIALNEPQKKLLAGFQREMLVAVVAGAWCGDCIQQCPMFEAFARETSRLKIRYFDRDEHGDLADELSICGGRRVPSVLFMAEDGAPCGRYGDRTLAKYRDSAAAFMGAACPTGIVPQEKSLQSAVVQEWLDQFERIQLMLRLSPRLRQTHGD